MLIEFDFDPETGEYTPISREVIEDDKPIKKKTTKSKDDGSTEPIITLEENKYVLNSRAVEALGVEWEDKISIIYQNHNGNLVPVIGKDENLNVSSGNKLTKSKTVACRGKNREKLAEHGDEFKLVPLGDGTFVMDSGKQVPYKEEKKRTDSKITVVEDEEDLPIEATLDGEGDEEIKEEFTFEL